MSVLDAAARAVWAVTYPDALDTYDDPELRPERDLARAQARAALAVAPAPSEDDRKALASAIIDAAWDEGPHPDIQTALVWADAILAAGFRRSPVSPPVDVKPGAGSLSVERPNESRPDTPPEDVTALLAEANAHLARLAASFQPGSAMAQRIMDGTSDDERISLIARLAAALRAPVPVEVQYRARAADGYVYGESRTTPEAAVAAYEEALDRVTLEQADETPVVEERAVTPWVLHRPTREEENR